MLQKTYEKMLCFLAHTVEATQYGIANATKLTYAPVHQAVKQLLDLKFIQETKREQGKGPLPNRFFKLTFKGFITALVFFIENAKSFEEMRRNIENAINTHANFYPENKIFSEWSFLKNVFNDEIYEVLEVVGIYWFNNVVFFSHPLYPPKGEEMEKAVKEMLEEEKKRWQPIFNNYFLDTLHSFLKKPVENLSEATRKRISRGTPNATFEAFIKEVSKKRKTALMRKLKECEDKEKALLTQFGV